MSRALDVAKYVIAYENSEGRKISNLRLQKLLYFTQAMFLSQKGSPCFDDDIEAWTYGPVIPNVYHKYKIFGALDIPFPNNPDNEGVTFQKNKPFINSVLDQCARYDTPSLIEITHQQSIWKKAYHSNLSNIIDKEVIRKFYKD